MSEHKVFLVKEISDFPNSIEAKKLLNRLVKCTESLLRKRKWRVHNLREFYPPQASLLGLNENRGYTIRIRLRSAENKNAFLPWESIFGTMIHELTHIEESAHSAAFYALMDKVYDDAESSQFSFTSGSSVVETFEGTGHKLGGVSRGELLGAHTGKLAAAAAVRRLAGGSDRVSILGGSRNMGTIRDQAAAAALKREFEQSCSSAGRTGSSSDNADFAGFQCTVCLEVARSGAGPCGFCGSRTYGAVRDAANSNSSSHQTIKRKSAHPCCDVCAGNAGVDAAIASTVSAGATPVCGVCRSWDGGASAKRLPKSRPPAERPRGEEAASTSSRPRDEEVVFLFSRRPGADSSSVGRQSPTACFEWSCPRCTFSNSSSGDADKCAMCGSGRLL